MSKRKQNTDKEDSDSDVSLIDVDFEFFDPNPAVDYHALKRLIIQLFQGDAEILHPHELAELILNQPLLGTTVKTDGKESDPYAFLTVLNLQVHQNHPSIKALISYILSKSTSNPPFNSTLKSLFSSQSHIGFVFCERLINMPVQVVPPMYRMLADEIKWALDDDEPYDFTHLIFISRTYKLSLEEEQAMQSTSSPPSTKRHKALKNNNNNNASTPADGIYSFHPEDECIMEVSSHTQSYSFSSAQPREKDSFGLDTGGRIMLIETRRLSELITSMAERYAVPG